MIKVKTLSPLQTYVIMIVPTKHLSRTRTLKLHMNLYNIHHRRRVTPLRRLKLAILLRRIARETNLVILEVVKLICALTLILSIQRYTDILGSELGRPAKNLRAAGDASGPRAVPAGRQKDFIRFFV